MKAWLKKHWMLTGVVALAVAALVLWRLWPKTAAVRRKITFTELPVITGDAQAGAPSDDSIADKDESSYAPDQPSDLDGLLADALRSYDNG